MKIFSCEDDSGRTAIGIKLDDGVLPSGHSDVTALIKAGPRELNLIRRASQRPSQLVHPKKFRAPAPTKRPRGRGVWSKTGEGNRQMMSGLALSESRDSVGFAARPVAALTARRAS
jgi:hypothetical protein